MKEPDVLELMQRVADLERALIMLMLAEPPPSRIDPIDLHQHRPELPEALRKIYIRVLGYDPTAN